MSIPSIETLLKKMDTEVVHGADLANRLEFDEEKRLIEDSVINEEILSIIPEEPKESLTRSMVINKLYGYQLLTNKLNTKPRRWYRYINKNDGLLRAGGFVIKNDSADEFVVFKNVSKNYTFSVKRDDIIMFEKMPKGDPYYFGDKTYKLWKRVEDKHASNKPIMVVFDSDLQMLFGSRNVSEVAMKTKTTRVSVKKAADRGGKMKNFYIFRYNDNDLDWLDGFLPIATKQREGLPADVMKVVNQYYK